MLCPGSRIAAISLSWGGPGTLPDRYQIGKRQFEEEYGVTVLETEHALRDAVWLSKNPVARADDLMAAFADETIDGIISTIGGEDSIRTLPYLDLDLIRSDSTHTLKRLLLPISIGSEIRSVEFFLCGVVPLCYV